MKKKFHHKIFAISLSSLLLAVSLFGSISVYAEELTTPPNIGTAYSYQAQIYGRYLGPSNPIGYLYFYLSGSHPEPRFYAISNSGSIYTTLRCMQKNGDLYTSNNVSFFWAKENATSNSGVRTSLEIANYTLIAGGGIDLFYVLQSLPPNVDVRQLVADYYNTGILDTRLSMVPGSIPPVDPDYIFDNNLGYLQNVKYKQVYNQDTGLSTLDVTFDSVTSTGVDLSLDNYGVAISYQAYNNAVDDIPFWKSAIYRFLDLSLETSHFLLHASGLVDDSINNLNLEFTGGGGGHSFGAPDNNESIYLYDLILSPYYFDGTDEYFGFNTMISKVSADSVGTRMISTGTVSDGGQDDTETYMNSSQLITYYYDYGPESTYLDESTQYYYYTTNNDFSTTAVTNDYGDYSTIINNIDNSTQNIYNFQGVGEIPDLDLSQFNIGLQEFISMIKGVIVSLIIAFPMLSGLFDFLPVFAVSIAIAATQAVAIILIIRIFRGVGI